MKTPPTALFLFISVSAFSQKTIILSQNYTSDFKSIQQAIDKAKPGTTIFVKKGTYHISLIPSPSQIDYKQYGILELYYKQSALSFTINFSQIISNNKHLVSGKNVQESFNLAQDYMKNKYKDNPFSWAAFVLIE